MPFHNVLVACHAVLLLSAVAVVGWGWRDRPVQPPYDPAMVIATLPPSSVPDLSPPPRTSFIDLGTIVIKAKAHPLPHGPVTQQSAVGPCSRRPMLQGSGSVIECEGGQPL